MLVIPALDLKDHKVVRLKQGRLEDETVYSDDVIDVASKWIDQGATRLHLVDLNGAFEGKPIHANEVQLLRKKFPDIQIEIGGGLRSQASLAVYFDAGVDFCILGTVAVRDPLFFKNMCESYPGKIILGLDAKKGWVATEGWAESSQTKAVDLIQSFKGLNIESIIYTDIEKDGLLKGMNFSEISEVAACGFPVIGSGGLTSLTDIDELKKIKEVVGVIAGKAIYENRFTVAEAIERAEA